MVRNLLRQPEDFRGHFEASRLTIHQTVNHLSNSKPRTWPNLTLGIALLAVSFDEGHIVFAVQHYINFKPYYFKDEKIIVASQRNYNPYNIMQYTYGVKESLWKNFCIDLITYETF